MGSQAAARVGVFCGAALVLAALRADLGRCSLGCPEDGSLPITHLNGDAERIAERRWEVRPRGYPVPQDRGFVHSLAHTFGQSVTGLSIVKKAARENPEWRISGREREVADQPAFGLAVGTVENCASLGDAATRNTAFLSRLLAE